MPQRSAPRGLSAKSMQPIARVCIVYAPASVGIVYAFRAPARD